MAGGMSAECPEPGPGGPQGQSPGPGRQCPPPTTPAPWSLPRWRAYVAAAVLCYINLLNYMNWFIIAGVLLDVQEFFQISDSHAGLLQTDASLWLLSQAPSLPRPAGPSALPRSWGDPGCPCVSPPVFIGCLLLSAPVFGYLGDRYSRKTTMSFGILLWSGAGLSSSFISPRIMPCLEAVALILLILLVPDPPRGAAETQGEGAAGGSRSSWCEDVRYLGKNWGTLSCSWSFVWSTLGVTAMAFVTGALGFWAPKFLLEARVVHGLQPPCFQEPCSNPDSLIFGSLTIMTGVIGVILGAEAARRYKKVIPRAEPLICASSLLATAPCLYLALVLAPTTLLASYVFLGLGELLLSCNWAVVADILLSVVVPRCRGTAEALQITVGHILGDAGSPYLTGLISSVLRARRPDSYLQRFLSLQQSFLCCAFVIALGGGCFLLTALYLERDEARAWQPGTGTPDSKDVDSNDLERQGLLSGAAASTEEP
ncbi:protein spinster homolog 3 isoform X6 [Papio anubis]|uniref:protein spinster homolog 3 isoform X6 n=1 Tax=Papio anubis TaxID=9555 RepID=UPI0012AE45F8|nr:protein spinster homolog 3 isoform X6 [Papio anubis]